MLSWHPSSKHVASVCADGTIMVTQLGEMEEYNVKNYGTRCLQWSPDGTLLASGGSALSVWDLKNKTQTLAAISVSCLAFSPCGKYLAASDGNIYTVPALTVQKNFKEAANVMSWSAAGLAIGFADGSLMLYPDGVVLDKHGSECTALNWSSDGRYLTAGYKDGKIVSWDGRKRISTCSLGSEIRSLSWNPQDNKSILVVSPNQTSLRASLTMFESFEEYVGGPFSAGAISPDGAHVGLLSEEDGEVYIFSDAECFRFQ